MKALLLGAAAVGAWLALRGRPPPFEITAHLEDGRRTPTSDGRLYSRAFGAGADVLMLPGFCGNTRTWEFVTPRLAREFRVHWLDLLGHGLSDKPAAARYDAAAHAARVIEWMDAQRLARTVVAASSAGAQTAVRLAADYPARVGGLLLVSPFLVANLQLRLAVWLLRALPGPTGMLAQRLYAQRWYVRLGQMLGRCDAWGTTSADVDRQYLTFGTPGFLEALPAMLAGVDPLAHDQAIARTACPVLTIIGETDRVAAYDLALGLVGRFADAELRVIPQTGHLPHEEAPDAFLERAAPFLARTACAAAAGGQPRRSA